MKKLLALCAAAALALGIAGCANEDATLSVDDALDTTRVTATLVTNVTNFTLKDSAGEEVEALEINFGDSAVLTPSTADGIKAESDDEDVAKATVASTGKITVEGVAAGSAVVTVTLSGITVAVIPVTVNPKVTYTVEFKGLGANPADLTATINDASAEYITSADDLEFTYDLGFTEENSGTAEGATNSKVIASNGVNGDTRGYKVTITKNKAVTKDAFLGTFYTTVTAEKDIMLDSVQFRIGSSGFNVYGKVAVVAGDEDVYTTAASTASKGSAGNFDVSSEELTLAAGESAKIVIKVYADNTKAANAGINFGIDTFKIVAVAAEE